MTAGRKSAAIPQGVETLMLDMDGTVLDLAYDNYLWLTRVPEAYAERHGLSAAEARDRLYTWFLELRGTLDWYCLEHWSERLQLDVVALHREHREQIDFLPGALEFLQSLRRDRLRVLLVTNSHRTTLDLKNDRTGLGKYFDAIYTSHDLGHPKEQQAFWLALQEEESLAPESALFVDDTLPVLHSAKAFGLLHVRHVICPDTSRPAQVPDAYPVLESLQDLQSPAPPRGTWPGNR